jgi:hypothetical protein
MKKLIGIFILSSFAFASQSILKPNAPKISPDEVKLYNQLPKKLTPADCAACHVSIYNKMRKTLTKIKLPNGKVFKFKKPIVLGGKHRFYCTHCHTKFHEWNPKKGIKGWEALMPKCSNCHTSVHGAKFKNCMTCHNDPHAINMPMAVNDPLKKNCQTCHADVANFMKAHKSKHYTKTKCYACHHDLHGYIPTCGECHAGHAVNHKQAPNKLCYTCHGYSYAKRGETWKAAHAPLPVTYGKKVPNENCAWCHKIVYNHLTASYTKHSTVACIACHHDKHGYIPTCAECHGKYPHGKAIHQAHPNCLECHISPHDPAGPVNPHDEKYIKEEFQREKQALQILKKWRKTGVPLEPKNLQKLPSF